MSTTRSGKKFRKSILPFLNLAKPKINKKRINMAALAPDKVIDIVAKIMPNDYNGCPLLLNNIVDKLEILRSSVNHADNQQLLVSLIRAKLNGKARSAISDQMITVAEISQALKTGCKEQSS